ncbi:hypothetical protein EIP86_010007 [Pleurotus ostreatoroseus]|nr:hypothetical protein EIP86_010007 [Pleurotus ostreatoroseus]
MPPRRATRTAAKKATSIQDVATGADVPAVKAARQVKTTPSKASRDVTDTAGDLFDSEVEMLEGPIRVSGSSVTRRTSAAKRVILASEHSEDEDSLPGEDQDRYESSFIDDAAVEDNDVSDVDVDNDVALSDVAELADDVAMEDNTLEDEGKGRVVADPESENDNDSLLDDILEDNIEPPKSPQKRIVPAKMRTTTPQPSTPVKRRVVKSDDEDESPSKKLKYEIELYEAGQHPLNPRSDL